MERRTCFRVLVCDQKVRVRACKSVFERYNCESARNSGRSDAHTACTNAMPRLTLLLAAVHGALAQIPGDLKVRSAARTPSADAATLTQGTLCRAGGKAPDPRGARVHQGWRLRGADEVGRHRLQLALGPRGGQGRQLLHGQQVGGGVLPRQRHGRVRQALPAGGRERRVQRDVRRVDLGRRAQAQVCDDAVHLLQRGLARLPDGERDELQDVPAAQCVAPPTARGMGAAPCGVGCVGRPAVGLHPSLSRDGAASRAGHSASPARR